MQQYSISPIFQKPFVPQYFYLIQPVTPVDSRFKKLA